jgi:hypothetical protein
MRTQFRMQMDLFIAPARVDLGGADRQKAVELLQALLTEALTKSTSEQPIHSKKEAAMNKITGEHLVRGAFVYVRQSTAYQVVNNLESQRRQYGLVEARHLGWDDDQLVDDDLG